MIGGLCQEFIDCVRRMRGSAVVIVNGIDVRKSVPLTYTSNPVEWLMMGRRYMIDFETLCDNNSDPAGSKRKYARRKRKYDRRSVSSVS